MPKLLRNEMFRLFGVSENLDENGQYSLMPFGGIYDEAIVEGEIDETLTDLVNDLYGQVSASRWYEITDDMYDDGKIYIEIESEDYFAIRDTTDKIDVDPERSRLYIFVNPVCMDYQWAVAVSQGTVYSG
jgi:hypothetical protein